MARVSEKGRKDAPSHQEGKPLAGENVFLAIAPLDGASRCAAAAAALSKPDLIATCSRLQAASPKYEGEPQQHEVAREIFGAIGLDALLGLAALAFPASESRESFIRGAACKLCVYEAFTNSDAPAPSSFSGLTPPRSSASP